MFLLVGCRAQLSDDRMTDCDAERHRMHAAYIIYTPSRYSCVGSLASPGLPLVSLLSSLLLIFTLPCLLCFHVTRSSWKYVHCRHSATARGVTCVHTMQLLSNLHVHLMSILNSGSLVLRIGYAHTCLFS